MCYHPMREAKSIGLTALLWLWLVHLQTLNSVRILTAKGRGDTQDTPTLIAWSGLRRHRLWPWP